MNAHHRDRAVQQRDPNHSHQASENIHEIIVGVLIASLTVGAIPIFQLGSLSNRPEPSFVVPSEATLWSSEVSD
jgi:hypothetical protein